jgi:hypothetical protein
MLYPLAGWLMTMKGTAVTLTWMTIAAFAGLVIVSVLWPGKSPEGTAGKDASKP